MSVFIQDTQRALRGFASKWGASLNEFIQRVGQLKSEIAGFQITTNDQPDARFHLLTINQEQTKEGFIDLCKYILPRVQRLESVQEAPSHHIQFLSKTISDLESELSQLLSLYSPGGAGESKGGGADPPLPAS